MRQSDSYPSRIALLRTLLLIRLGIQKKGDTLLGHAVTALWDDHIPSACSFIETAGSLFDQSPEAEKRRSVKAGLDAQNKLTETAKQRLVRQRARKREFRNWGDRARQLIGSLPDVRFVSPHEECRFIITSELVWFTGPLPGTCRLAAGRVVEATSLLCFKLYTL
jgi:hypothetical protein